MFQKISYSTNLKEDGLDLNFISWELGERESENEKEKKKKRERVQSNDEI